MNKALDSLHDKILNSKFASEVTEGEIEALVEAKNNGWIYCSERMPEEHDSFFAEYKGTDKWRKGMFEKISDDVNATVEYENGTRKTKTLHTVDGVWKLESILKCEVIAWQHFPEPLEERE